MGSYFIPKIGHFFIVTRRCIQLHNVLFFSQNSLSTLCSLHTSSLCSLHTSYRISKKVYFCLTVYFRHFTCVGSVVHGPLVRTFVTTPIQCQAAISAAETIAKTAGVLTTSESNSPICSIGGVVAVQR